MLDLSKRRGVRLERRRERIAPTVRIERDALGRYHLHRGADNSKDQTYFLFSLTQEQLARAAFPVGHLDKHTVRDSCSCVNENRK